MSYIQVPREAMIDRLVKAGFSRFTDQGGEIVYYRRHHAHPDLMVKVYTSLPSTGGDVRASGTDAIRVVAVFDARGRSFGVYKAIRVHRTGTVEGVLERMVERMREAYAHIRIWSLNQS